MITSVTASFNENSSNNALVKRVYFTDDESDSITITSTSIDNEHFDITVYSNYFDIRQNTGSLDYEVQSLYIQVTKNLMNTSYQHKGNSWTNYFLYP